MMDLARLGTLALLSLLTADVAFADTDGGVDPPCWDWSLQPAGATVPLDSPGFFSWGAPPTSIERIEDGTPVEAPFTWRDADGPYYRSGLVLELTEPWTVGDRYVVTNECETREFQVTPALGAPDELLTLMVEPTERTVLEGPDVFKTPLRMELVDGAEAYANVWMAHVELEHVQGVGVATVIEPSFHHGAGLTVDCLGAGGWEPGSHVLTVRAAPIGADPAGELAWAKSFEIELVCPPGGDLEPEPADAGTGSEPDSGGCSAGGGAGSLGAPLALLLLALRRRR